MQKASSTALDHDEPVANTDVLPTGTLSSQPSECPDQPADFSSDAVLLKRFIRSRDPIAFTMLVERYQRLVMGVALRQVGDRHRAEDVFQATFLILAEQANKIRKPNSLASWLHGTARRIGLRALSDSQRHPTTSSSDLSYKPDTAMSDPALQNVEHAFEQQALDEELAKLPDQLREPLVLHYLEGLTGQEVAARLNLTVDTVEGRLKRGRNQLRNQLMRRGIGFGIVIAAFQMSQQSVVAASTSTLVEATTTSAVAWVSQQTLQGCSANAAHLAGKELAAMTASKTTTLMVCTAIICLTGGAIGTWALESPGSGRSGKGDGQVTIQTTLLAQADAANSEATAATPIDTSSNNSGEGSDVSGRDEDLFPNLPDASKVLIGSDKSDLTIWSEISNPNEVNTIGTHIENRTYSKMSPARKAVEEKLDQPIPLDINNNATIEYLIEALIAINLPAKVNSQALEDAGLSVGEETLGPHFDIEGMTLREKLDNLMDSTVLTYIIKNGVITITTKEDAEIYLETVVYEVRHLGANLPSGDVAELFYKIPDSSWYETDGDGGSVNVIPGGIVVSQNQATHRKIVQLLEQLEDFAAKTDLPQVERDPATNTPFNSPYPGGQSDGGMGGMGGGG